MRNSAASGDESATAHLKPAKIKNKRVPVGMISFARVGMLIQCRTIELGEAMRIRRKMCRYPVQYNAEPSCMTCINEFREILRRSQLRHGRELTKRLITPGAAERMAHDGHKFNMGEAEVRDVRDQPCRQLVPVIGAPVQMPYP